MARICKFDNESILIIYISMISHKTAKYILYNTKYILYKKAKDISS
jgi:hypothetical protein